MMANTFVYAIITLNYNKVMYIHAKYLGSKSYHKKL